MGGPGSEDPGRITCQCATLKMLLMNADKVKNYEVVGPAWLDNERFNIVAKVPAGSTRDQLPAMYRSLVAERFKAVVHREKRLVNGYALSVARNGSKLKLAVLETPGYTEPQADRLPLGDDGLLSSARPLSAPARRSSFAAAGQSCKVRESPRLSSWIGFQTS